jgi:hypothetical protein
MEGDREKEGTGEGEGEGEAGGEEYTMHLLDWSI